ncbi:DUF4177 domain-containing protein [Candidatus Poseidonia alphae]|nr:DUF4177 domain-containing protein [Candidatus Poseidonia alphae]
MVKYEYKVLNIPSHPRNIDYPDWRQWETEMNELGEEGWKIIESGEGKAISGRPYVILMREIN